MTIPNALLRELQVLALGRNLDTTQYQMVSSPNGPPKPLDGFDLGYPRPIVALVGIDLLTNQKASYRVWVNLKDDGWFLVPNSTRQDIETSEIERYTVSGVDRVYIEILSQEAAVKTIFKPAKL